MTQIIVCVAVKEADHPGEGWVVELAAVGNLLLIKRSVVMLQRCLNGIVLRVKGLDDDPATQYTPPGSTSHLGKKLEAPFCSAKIGQVKTGIGTDHTDQCYLRQIKSLGYHLSADKYIGFMPSKAVHDLLVAMLAMDCITIPAQDSGTREDKAGFLLKFLGAATDKLQALALAMGAGPRYRQSAIALVADENVFDGVIFK